MHLGRYRLLGRLGRGGMGGVYKVRHQELERIMALKLFDPREALTMLWGEREARTAFVREARVLARCDHEHVARVWDLDEDRGRPFMVLEYLDMNLGRLIGEGHILESPTRPMPLERALDLTIQALDGLEYLHDHGVVHLDVKPGNLMLDSLGRVKIIDLGLSRVSGQPRIFPRGLKIGTPGYCPPEQEKSPQQADQRADLYALAAVLYRLVTGRLPEEPLADTQGWDRFFAQALAASPADRFPHAEAMRAGLTTLRERLAEDECSWPHSTCAMTGPLRATAVRTGVRGHPFSFLDSLFRPIRFHDAALEQVRDGWRDPCLGLVWAPVSRWPMTWDEAGAYAAGLGPGWRLPTVEELVSLLRPWQNPAQFCQQPFDRRYLWIWTGDRRGFTSAWFVDVGSGAVLAQDMTCRFHVRPVRTA